MEVGEAVGVGKSTVRKWEIGMIANMKRDKIAKLAEVLRVSPAELMGWDVSDQVDYVIENPNDGEKNSPVRIEIEKKLDSYDSRTLSRLLSYLELMDDWNGGDPK